MRRREPRFGGPDFQPFRSRGCPKCRIVKDVREREDSDLDSTRETIDRMGAEPLKRWDPDGSGWSESEAARRAAAGDPVAFEQLYRGHVDRIHSLARRMIDGGSADDLTQEVFIRAWKKLPSFRGDSSFGTWLYRLAINWILSRRRTIRREAERQASLPRGPELVRTTRPRPDHGIDLERALETLPDGAREVFVLHDVEGYRHAEVAELLDISVGTSKSQLHRARMLLRRFLA